LWASGEFEAAIAASHERIRISKLIGNDWNYSAGLSMLAMAHHEIGEFGRSIEYAEEGLQIIEQSGNFNVGVNIRIAQILVYVATGVWQQAQDVAGPLFANRDKIISLLRPMAMAALARIQIEQGEFEEAERLLIETIEAADLEAMATAWVVIPYVAHAHLLLATNDPERALERTNYVIGRLRQSGMRLQLAETLWLKGKALEALGKSDQAYKALLEAKSVAEQTNGRRMLWLILASLAELEDLLGNAAEAGNLRVQAREIITYIADHAGSEDLRASFLSLPDVQSILAK